MWTARTRAGWTLLLLGALAVVLVSARYFTADPATTEPFAALLAANVAGAVASPAPLLVLHAPGDFVVPIAQSEALTQRLCAGGQVVELRVLAADAAHGVTHTAATSEGVDWLSGLADGTGTATTTC